MIPKKFRVYTAYINSFALYDLCNNIPYLTHGEVFASFMLIWLYLELNVVVSPTIVVPLILSLFH
jgi:hypothetical protein